MISRKNINYILTSKKQEEYESEGLDRDDEDNPKSRIKVVADDSKAKDIELKSNLFQNVKNKFPHVNESVAMKIKFRHNDEK
jgi:hypothetical protein